MAEFGGGMRIETVMRQEMTKRGGDGERRKGEGMTEGLKDEELRDIKKARTFAKL